ncbi:MAG: T9SS type A sorting domain-containing protein [Ignavibacteriaceae bacterium]|nr:T9SS type A sorting domain-containing protein [Ignavibacteriaceae bacterium]
MKSIIKIALLIYFFPYCFSYGQPGNWEIAGKMPIKISGSESVVVDSTIYFFGGYSDSLQNAVDWIYSYTPAQNNWKLVGHMKKKRINFIADRIGNKIYFAGGEGNNQPRGSGTIEEFDCSTFKTTVIDSDMQFNRLHSTGLIKDSNLIVIGGMTATPPDQIPPYIIEYNIPAKKIIYNFVPSFPGMRTQQMATSLFNNLYIFGGLFNTVSSEINVFGLSDHSFILQQPGLLRPRANGRVIKIDSNRVVILGGYNEINPALNSVELYTFTDSMHFSGRLIQPMNFKRNNFMAVSFNNSVYVFGGDDDFGNPVDAIEKLKFSTISGITGNTNQSPTTFGIEQNYPNPFNLSTLIRYQVSETSFLSIKVYDITGREVTNLVNEEKQPGSYVVSFNGAGLASGVYYYRVEGVSAKGSSGKSFTETKKMILLK